MRSLLEDQSHSEVPAKLTELPGPLRTFLLLSATLTIVSFVYTIVCRGLGLGLPYSFPYYYVPGDMFRDFFGFQQKFHLWGTPAFFDHTQDGYFMYPAPLVHVFRLFLNLPHARTCFLATLLLVSASLVLGFVSILRREGLATSQSLVFAGATAFVSYPLILLLQRGNIEVLIWLAGSLGVWSFLAGRTNQSAVLLGIAASLKFYPLLFLGLFLPRRRYSGFVLCLATFAAVTLLSLHGIGPTVAAAQRWDAEQIAAFSRYYVGSLWNLGSDHSFFGLVKLATLHWRPDYFAWARPYSITVALLSLALYVARIWRMPLVNQVLALSVLSVTIAPVSYDYTLLNLYPAFAMLAVLALRQQRGEAAVPFLTVFMALFALVFTPQSYIIVHGVRYAAQLRAVCLLALLVLSLVKPVVECDPAAPSFAQALETAVQEQVA
jgi:hypothetical protein